MLHKRRILVAAALVLCGVARAQAPFDVLLTGARVVDGTGAPWFRADVGVRGGRIAEVGDLASAPARRRIDVHDQMVAPGFIDMLGQSELFLLIDNRAESKIRMGITTELSGEGGSPAPTNAKLIEEMRPFLERYHLNIDWTDLAGYFQRLEK